MNKLNRLGVSLLIGYLLSNSFSEQDFNDLKKTLDKKIKEISPYLQESIYDIYQLINDNFNKLEDNSSQEKVNNKIIEVKKQLEKIKEDEISDIILSKLNK